PSYTEGSVSTGLCRCPVEFPGCKLAPHAAPRSGAAQQRFAIPAGPSGSMDIYLPIAEVSLDVTALLALGAAIGFLSGVFGVGGGFLLTPLLIFIGVPPAVAVASSANQLVGASVSGVIAHWRR